MSLAMTMQRERAGRVDPDETAENKRDLTSAVHHHHTLPERLNSVVRERRAVAVSNARERSKRMR